MVNVEEQEKERKQREAEFHDKREKDRRALTEEEYLRQYSNKQIYGISRKSRKFLTRWLQENCPGRKVLDYCCGLGQVSVEIARYGGVVYGIDVSEESVRTAREASEMAGVADHAFFAVGDGERLCFADSSFDVIVCSGVLHHLDVRRAFPEIARVLKSGGKVLCLEPLGYNPAINLYRKLTPQLRTEWEADHILKFRDIAVARQNFGDVQLRYFHLFTLLALPFRKTPLFSPILTLMEWCDKIAMGIPGVQLMAWQVFLTLQAPMVKRSAIQAESAPVIDPV